MYDINVCNIYKYIQTFTIIIITIINIIIIITIIIIIKIIFLPVDFVRK